MLVPGVGLKSWQRCTTDNQFSTILKELQKNNYSQDGGQDPLSYFQCGMFTCSKTCGGVQRLTMLCADQPRCRDAARSAVPSRCEEPPSAHGAVPVEDQARWYQRDKYWQDCTCNRRARYDLCRHTNYKYSGKRSSSQPASS
jgi:hypothetical protein